MLTKNRTSKIEAALVVMTLLLLSRAFVPFFTSLGTVGATIQLGLYVAVLGTIFVLIAARLGQFLFALSKDKLLLVIVGFVCLSVLWSAAPQATLRSLPVFLGATALGVYLAIRFDQKQQMRLLAWTFAISAVLSLAFGAFLQVGVMHDGLNAGSWQGIYGHKNDLGRFMALAVLLLALLPGRKTWRGAVIAVACILILLSRSATSLTTLAIMIMLIPLLRLIQWRQVSIMPVALAIGVLLLAIIVFLIVVNLSGLVSLLGKDLTLTGRTALWVDVWAKIREHLLLGYGYNAFWLGNVGESADIWARHGWQPNHAHNGFLDLWLELGLVGVGLVIAHIVRSGWRAFRCLQHEPSTVGLWPIALITILLLFNFNYSVLVSQSVFFWTVYLGSCLAVAKQGRARRYRENAEPVRPPATPELGNIV